MPPTDEQFWILACLGVVALVLAVVLREFMRGRPDPLPLEGPLRLIVRPLRELRPDPNHLYLGTTIARELVLALKKYERLDTTLGEQLAPVSLEGTVRKTGPRIVMNIRLLSGRHPVWRGAYDGAINDLPTMQEAIVANVARTLRVGLRKPLPNVGSPLP